MAEDREPQHRAPTGRRPAPAPPAPAAAPPLFGTGLGVGMGPPTTVVESLALRPADERADVLRDLQRGAGNQSVSRMLMGAADDGDLPGSGPVSAP